MNAIDIKSKLSTLWIFLTLNYLYCDIEGLMDKNLLSGYLQGFVGGMSINENFLLGAAILMEIPIIMVIISKFCKYKINKIFNIIAGIIMTIVQATTLFVGDFTSYYLFFSIIEISTTLFIIYYSLIWKEEKS